MTGEPRNPYFVGEGHNDLHGAWAEGFAAGRAAERAATTDWLRWTAFGACADRVVAERNMLADRIAGGEHESLRYLTRSSVPSDPETDA